MLYKTLVFIVSLRAGFWRSYSFFWFRRFFGCSCQIFAVSSLGSSNSVEKLCDSWVWVRRYVALVVSVPIPLRTQRVRTPTRRKAFFINYASPQNLPVPLFLLLPCGHADDQALRQNSTDKGKHFHFIFRDNYNFSFFHFTNCIRSAVCWCDRWYRKFYICHFIKFGVNRPGQSAPTYTLLFFSFNSSATARVRLVT